MSPQVVQTFKIMYVVFIFLLYMTRACSQLLSSSYISKGGQVYVTSSSHLRCLCNTNGVIPCQLNNATLPDRKVSGSKPNSVRSIKFRLVDGLLECGLYIYIYINTTIS